MEKEILRWRVRTDMYKFGILRTGGTVTEARAPFHRGEHSPNRIFIRFVLNENFPFEQPEAGVLQEFSHRPQSILAIQRQPKAA